MGRAAQVYDFSVAAGELAVILAEGSYYRILSATGPVSVRRDDGSKVGPLLEGQGERNSPFQRLTIQDLSGAANSGTVLVCDGDFVDHRQAGAAEVLDGAYRLTKADDAFHGYASNAPSAGQYGHVQLFNPTADKVAIVTKVWPGSYSAAPVFTIASYSTQLTNLAANPSNLRLGSAVASGMQMRTELNASLLGSRFATRWATTTTPVDEWTLKQPIYVGPGQGLILRNETANAALAATFEFIEFPAP